MSKRSAPLEILSKEESAEVLRDLCYAFGAEREARIVRYVRTRPIRLFGGFLGFDSGGVGTLWYPQDANMHYVGDIWENVKEFSQAELWEAGTLANFYRAVAQAFQACSSKRLYGVGEWNDMAPNRHEQVGHRALSFNCDLLPGICQNLLITEGYFFPHDLARLFCVTHEDVMFLAGDDQFLQAFKEAFPSWSRYLAEHSMLGQ